MADGRTHLQRKRAACLCVWMVFFFALTSNAHAETSSGVEVGKPSILRHLAPTAAIETSAAKQYQQLLENAKTQGVLLAEDAPLVLRLRKIASAIHPFTKKWNPRAHEWRWQLSVINSPTLNAFCLPGGKIVFFTGIVEALKLTDAEIAMIMAHEIAHVLREHGRERVGTQVLIQGLAMVGRALGLDEKAGGLAGVAGRAVGVTTQLAFSRGDETEADLVGLELAARAGYAPEAGISLWRKMAAASQGKNAPPQFLSTHPAHDTRISDIQKNIAKVKPLYDASVKRK